MMLAAMMKNHQNIHKITLPTGFQIGDVNVYLINEDPVTLIDTGVNGAISEHIFNKRLGELGLTYQNIKRIVITHTHLDHCGMAGRIQDLSGAVLLIHKSKLGDITNITDTLLTRPRTLKNFYAESAVPKALFSRSLKNFQKSIYLSSNAKEAVPLVDEDELEFENFSLKVIHTPGHSDDMLCLFDTKRKILFSSDHITLHTHPSLRLREIFTEKNGNLGNMNDYLNSLKKIESLDVTTTFPGHGETFGDPKSVIKTIRDIYLERKELIAEILRKGNKNRFELARSLFGFLNDRELFKGIPEVTGHLELLEGEGKLTKWAENGIMYYHCK